MTRVMHSTSVSYFNAWSIKPRTSHSVPQHALRSNKLKCTRLHTLCAARRKGDSDHPKNKIGLDSFTESREDKIDEEGLQLLSPGTGMEIVLHATREEANIPIEKPEEPYIWKSTSARRTQRLRFTCNKCGETTERTVNPRALTQGTVFVQCKHCLVQHKLVDNLNLFNDLQGPSFEGSSSLWRRGGADAFQADWEAISRMKGFSVWDDEDLFKTNNNL
mmetsp:Transcript_7118/g.9631  ORF Transcript_7118/g.9631 Transcript_7118/m.9631 type:complete len:219 (-) Transcript_7118:142-798(-)|eukprot:CAMPEP_0196587520 /NCGR_PEP_ID=MMETSP1081-20130531/57684_1 /TAXON_ID=36882 /ORGANISM="Pyramimonas amylifera, Strain CCMP720" /LENGTH=218 /DNA_ID=CAMNT_0041909717 /DNA_START=182 /DNA_END=838 /DNA_ORIENTATION=-